MNDQHITAKTYPAVYAGITGEHRLVGWGNFETLHHAILMHTFGWMVKAAIPVVKEFHGDLFTDADWIRRHLTELLEADEEGRPKNTHAAFLYCVRHSGTNTGGTARFMFESLAYDAALYNFEVRVDARGEWFLRVDLLDARPTRPVVEDYAFDDSERKPRLTVGENGEPVVTD